MTALEAAVRWWLALTVVAAALAPFTWWLGAGLGVSRHALLRPVGLVAGTFLLWWPAALIGVPFSRATLIAVLLVITLIGWTLLIRRGHPILSGLKGLLLFEAVWLVAFAGYLWFRSTNPDIANTEKPMEIALLSSITRSGDVPAPDPWFAGEPINYYYFGYQKIAALAHLSGVEPSVAFNLALGMVFASSATVAAGLGAWLAHRAGLKRPMVIAAASLSGFCVTLAGNLETTKRLLRSPGDTISAGWWDGVGWQASRVITDHGVNGDPGPVETINEFPAFALVLGDLHPHLTTLPALLAAVALAAGLALNRELITWPRAAAAGAFAGLLYASNSWDAPVGVVALIGAILLARRRFDRETAVLGVAAVAGAVAAALPFALHYTAPVGVDTGSVPGWLSRIPVVGTLPNTLAVVTWRPSSAGELLTVHGAWIAAFVVFGIWALRSAPTVQRFMSSHGTLMLPLALIVVAGAIAWAPALLLLGLPAALGLLLTVLDERPVTRLLGALFAAGFALALVPEFLFIQDAFGNRMNTVFKLGFQAWIFLGVVAPVGLLVAIHSAERFARRGALAMLGLVVVASIPYAPLSVEDWAEMGTAGGTLDGAAYLAMYNQPEAEAIAWLDAAAEEGDYIVEVPGCAYQSLNGIPMNRFSAFTGIPTLLGWANHERQWRRGEFETLSALTQTIDARRQLAERWLSGDPGGQPTPRFVIFGLLERTASERCDQLVARGEAEIQRLRAAGWEVAFQQGQTVILVEASDALVASGN